MNMGNNYGFPNMTFDIPGRDNTNCTTDDSDESSSVHSDDGSVSDSNIMSSNYNHTFQSDSLKFNLDEKITIETVKKIENDLDFYEIISLIFLLYDTNIALQVIRACIATGPKCFTKDKLLDWVRSQPEKWKTKLVESLAIIQNYLVLKKLGYNKNEIHDRFLPMKDATVYIDRPKKMLYRLCEYLIRNQAEKLISLVNANAKFVDNITVNCDPIYLEFHILYWISQNYLIFDEKEINLKNLTKHLKVMDLLDKAEEINCMCNNINEERKRIMFDKIRSVDHDDEFIYRIINPANVGLCIIINMTEFKKNIEKREQFKSSLPPESLSDRTGSFEDVKRLRETFTTMNFAVVEAHDIIHDKLEKTIQDLTIGNFKQNEHSALFLCILSHGSKGIVYAANSIPVKIKEIQNIVSGPSRIKDLLANKPKVIIVQACQGNMPLYVQQAKPSLTIDGVVNTTNYCLDGNDLCFDGPEDFTPEFSDVLTCMAIIEGYFAVRSIKEGTVYIQELCRCLKEFYKELHFLDIITRVHYKLGKEKLHIRPVDQSRCPEHNDCVCVYMTPTHFGTFRKNLYLVPRK